MASDTITAAQGTFTLTGNDAQTAYDSEPASGKGSTTLYTLSKSGAVNRYHSFFNVTQVSGKVSAWGDQIGTAHLTQTTAANRPLVSAVNHNGCRIRYDYTNDNSASATNQWLDIPSRAYDKRGLTIMFVMDNFHSIEHFQSGNEDSNPAVWFFDSNHIIEQRTVTNKRILATSMGAATFAANTARLPSSRFVFVVSWGANAAATSMWINGFQLADQNVAAAGTITGAAFLGGGAAGTDRQFYGGFDEVVIWDTSSTETECTNLCNDAMAAWKIRNKRLLTWHGDSITFGYRFDDRFGRRHMGSPGKPRNIEGGEYVQWNFSKPGAGLNDEVSKWTSWGGDTADPYLYRAGWLSKTAVVAAGVNDLRPPNYTAATDTFAGDMATDIAALPGAPAATNGYAAAYVMLNRLTTICTNLRDAGYTNIFVMPVLPADGFVTEAPEEQARVLFNRMVMDNARGLWTPIVLKHPWIYRTADTAAYYDGLHSTTALERIIADEMYPQIVPGFGRVRGAA